MSNTWQRHLQHPTGDAQGRAAQHHVTRRNRSRAYGRREFFNTNVTNPFAGLIPATRRERRAIARQRCSSRSRSLARQLLGEHVVRFEYNSLQASSKRRVARLSGFSYNFSKKWRARLINNQDSELPAVVDFDKPHWSGSAV